MKKTRSQDIRREQKKSFYLREISSLLQRLSIDEPDVTRVFVTRVDLSPDGGMCYIYLSTYSTQEDFDTALEKLKLYKPSMRQALAKSMRGRYVPNLVFVYDQVKEKTRRVEDILDEISKRQEEGDENDKT